MDTKTLAAAVSTALVIIQALASFFGVQPIQSQKVTETRETLEACPSVLEAVVIAQALQQAGK